MSEFAAIDVSLPKRGDESSCDLLGVWVGWAIRGSCADCRDVLARISGV